MKKLYFFLVMMIAVTSLSAQVSLTNGSPTVTINFSNTTPSNVGTNPTSAFSGAGFEPNPTTAGRLNSNAWAVTGWSDGALAFGGTRTTAATDYTRGPVAVAVTTGGMYAYTGAPGSVSNPSLMIQPGTSDWAPGTLTLRIQNNGTTNITELALSYNIFIRNDQARSSSFNFSHSADDVTYTPVGSLDYTSPAALDALGWVIVGSAPSRSTTITGLNITPGSFYYIRWSGADVGGSGSRDEFGLDDISLTATFAASGTPDIALSSPNPAVPAANMQQGSTNNVVYRFDLAVTTASATLTGVTVTTAGTYVAADLVNLKCWHSSDATFNAGSDQLLSTKTTGLGAGSQVFPSFTNQNISNGSTGYIFITADLNCTAVLGNTLSVNAITTADISFSSGNKSGTAFAGDAQTVTAGTPNNASTPGATNGNQQSSVSWTNPTGCYDEIMIVAAATTNNTGIPTGDGTAYTANLAFGSGTALGNGFVVYKGNTSPQVVTALTNGTTYFFKIFTRLGTVWSSGVETSATPNAVSSATDFFRSAGTGPWNANSSWESSADGSTNWIPATLTPTSTAAVITIRNTHNITITANVTIDQVVVDAGGTLTLNSNFTLADGALTDLDVNGTVVNSSGTHTFTGTLAFNANSLYQHNRNAGAIPTASWNLTSTVEFTGVTATAPTGLGQSFGNVTWNSPGQTASVNLSGALTTIGGNFTITSTSPTAGRVLRMTATATNPTLTIGGDFIISNADGKFEFSNGNATGAVMTIGGSFLMSAGTFSANVSGSMVVEFSGTNKDFNQSGGTLTNAQVNWTVLGGASLNLISNMPVASARTVTINGTLNASTLQITGAGAVAVNGTLLSTNANGIGITGTLANTGAKTLGAASTINFSSATAQTLNTRSDYANIIISGGGQKTTDGNVTMSGVLTLSSGLVILGSNNFIMTNNSPTGAIASYSASSYIVTNTTGALQRAVSGAGTYVFPVGITANLQEVSINFAAPLGAPNTLAVQYIFGIPGNNGLPLSESGDNINRTSVMGFWEINPGSPFADPYTGTFIAKNFTDIIDYTKIHLLKRANPAAPWVLDGTHVPTTGSNALATMQRTGMSGFSQFAPGGENNIGLPVTLLSFSGYKDGSRNQLRWTTATELNNLGFEVQRSADGVNYTVIGFVNSLATGGNSNDQISYGFTDQSPAGARQYYRLRQVDLGGKNKLSNIVLIRGSKPLIATIDGMFPNPVISQLNVLISAPGKEQVSLLVTDMSGKVLSRQIAMLGTGSNTVQVDVSKLASGAFLLRIVGEDATESVGKFIKQ